MIHIRHYELPDAWLLFVALLALPAAYWSLRGTGRVVFSSLRALPAGGDTWRTHLAWLPDALCAVAIAAFAIALAGPRKGDAATRIHREGIGIVMAVDISGSMRAQDLADDKRSATCVFDADHDPTRLGAVKHVFADFVDGRPDDAIGLITFARYADTRSPLTLQHLTLVDTARRLEFAKESEDGTAIGAGLELAVQRVLAFPTRSKIIVLLTDGESNIHEVDEDTAIDDAAKAGVKVYTIGAGKNGVAPICVDRGDGRDTLMQIPSSIDEGLLKKIADKTGGKYFRAQDGAALAAIYKQIDSLERTKIAGGGFANYHQYYGIFLGIALGLVVLALILRATVLRRLP